MEYIKTIFSERILKAVISNPKHKDGKYKKIEIELKKIGGHREISNRLLHRKTGFHENVEPDLITGTVEEIMRSESFRQLDAGAQDFFYMLKVSKKGKESLIKKRIASKTDEAITGNNRKKKYLLEENTSIPPLVDLGVFTKDGHIVSSMYDKYRQINRFVEIADNVVDSLKLSSINHTGFWLRKVVSHIYIILLSD